MLQQMPHTFFSIKDDAPSFESGMARLFSF
jgi:hypothetical protein